MFRNSIRGRVQSDRGQTQVRDQTERPNRKTKQRNQTETVRRERELKKKKRDQKVHASSFISRTVTSLSSSGWFLSRLAEAVEDVEADEDKQERDTKVDSDDLFISGVVV